MSLYGDPSIHDHDRTKLIKEKKWLAENEPLAETNLATNQ